MMNLKIKKLEVKKDNRGWLAEIISTNEIKGKGVGLVLITTANARQTKGSHYHKRKTEWYCVIRGRGLLKVWNQQEMEEFEVSEDNLTLVEIPKNHFHSITNVGDSPMYLLAVVSEPFNEKDPDTYYE